ncbi:uncharacterized protein EV154DRAFT_522038 [Mucor mucedo]|uniref:uncharacterized protein n=1 Tax=Mucor mucedo TaxID=29922 RepID=UPI00221E9D42|nr:uncharacterized protein EV154DRAFT_522038 [Mucor mucedo]KAI7884718.1 hypothetical protein EV154DRAFT_522038 [Mucor mucedo]
MGFFTGNEKDTEDQSDCSLSFSTERAFTKNDILICASYGNIYAIHKTDGSGLWKSPFKAGGGVISLFVTDSDKIIAGAFGKTACFDLMNGSMIWSNNMPGFGYEEVSVVSTPSRVLKPRRNPELSATSEHGSPPQYGESSAPEKPVVLACSQGKAMGIDISSGETLWTFNCPGGRYKIPVVVVEPPSMEEGRPHQLAYIGAAKWVYCLIAKTGKVVWSTKVATGIIGANFMSLATPWSSRLAAETHSAFSQNPSAQYLEIQRDKHRRSA